MLHILNDELQILNIWFSCCFLMTTTNIYFSNSKHASITTYWTRSPHFHIPSKNTSQPTPHAHNMLIITSLYVVNVDMNDTTFKAIITNIYGVIKKHIMLLTGYLDNKYLLWNSHAGMNRMARISYQSHHAPTLCVSSLWFLYIMKLERTCVWLIQTANLVALKMHHIKW